MLLQHPVLNATENPLFNNWRASTLSKLWLPTKPSPLAMPDKILLGLIWDGERSQHVALPGKVSFGWVGA